MPTLLGPAHWSDPFGEPDEPLAVAASTLGEALAAYQAAYGVELVESDEYDGRYFIHRDPRSGDELAVDIHVWRGEQELCPRQDRDFALLPDDRVVIQGLLAC